MQTKIFDTFDHAIADIPDGASILVAGFTEPGTPHNLLRALHFQGATGLTLIANSANDREGMITLSSLVSDKRARKVVLAFTASTHPSRRSAVETLEIGRASCRERV